jgi:hypothetical protein
MLAVTSYKPPCVESCRARIAHQLATYRALAAKAGPSEALGAFSADFCSSMILALDHMFQYRLRNAELKDGNPLNELRMLANSLMEGGGVLLADKTIKYDAAKAVAEIAVGQEIELDVDTFERFARAVLGEIEKKYP